MARPYQFQPGKSGNPGGRTKAAAAMHRLVPTMIAELTHGGADLVFLLLRIAAGSEPGMDDAKSRVFAIRELLDRGIGKPAFALRIETGPGADHPALDDRELSDEELRVLAKLDAPVLQLVPSAPPGARRAEAPPDGDDRGAG